MSTTATPAPAVTPYAAGLKRALLGSVTADDLHQIIRKLVEVAKEGCFQAIKMVLTHVTPTPTDRDRDTAQPYQPATAAVVVPPALATPAVPASPELVGKIAAALRPVELPSLLGSPGVAATRGTPVSAGKRH